MFLRQLLSFPYITPLLPPLSSSPASLHRCDHDMAMAASGQRPAFVTALLLACVVAISGQAYLPATMMDAIDGASVLWAFKVCGLKQQATML